MLYTSIPILFLFVGILAGVLFIGLIKLSKQYSLNWYSWVMASTGLVLILFTIAWSITSILEREPQAAGMGLIFFGMPGVILLLLTRRLIVKDSEELTVND